MTATEERVTSEALRAGIAAQCRIRMRAYALAWRRNRHRNNEGQTVALFKAIHWRGRALALERDEP